MPTPVLTILEAAGRTVRTLRVHDDPPYGREVHLVFTDGTQISIDLEVKTEVKAKHYRSETSGDLKVLHQHEERPTSDSSGKVQ